MIAVREVRLYLDTSPIIVILDNQDHRQAITKEFFRLVEENSNEYELFASPVTIEELTAGVEKHGDGTFLFLKSLDYTELQKNDDAEDLAQAYVSGGVLSQDHIDDLTHIAYSVVSRCDYVITWNMKHLAKEKTVSRVNALSTPLKTTAKFSLQHRIFLQEEKSMGNDSLPDDAVEMVREIRRRHYEATKHMSREEKRACDDKRYEEAKEYMANIKPDRSRFPFLSKK